MLQSSGIAGEPWCCPVCIRVLLGGGQFAEMLRVWYPPGRSPQGELPAGASSPWQGLYLGVGLYQGCVTIFAFPALQKVKGSRYIKYPRGIFSKSKVTSEKEAR